MKTKTQSKAVNLELTANILTNGRHQTKPVCRSRKHKQTDKKTIYTAILFALPIVVAILTSL